MSSTNQINFERAMYMLENTINSVNDLTVFWKQFGPARLGPRIERRSPWWEGLPS